MKNMVVKINNKTVQINSSQDLCGGDALVMWKTKLRSS